MIDTPFFSLTAYSYAVHEHICPKCFIVQLTVSKFQSSIYIQLGRLLIVCLKIFIFSLYNIDTFAHKRAENKMTDSKYFTTTKKGEIFELKSELNSDKKEKKKEAVKKVSAIGKNRFE